MKSKIQLLTLSVTLLASVIFVGVGCKGNMDRYRSDSRAPSTVTAYEREPSSSSNRTVVTANADNSRQNVRDRNDATLTPGDQGTTAADRDITQQVRKSLVNKDNGFSIAAQNVKIITVNGKVTLRGPVKTGSEKTGIVSLAKDIAGPDNVDDQLEVKANP